MKKALVTSLVFLVTMVCFTPEVAQCRDFRAVHPVRVYGGVRPGGHWVYNWHGGVLGWWLVAGTVWSLSSQPRVIVQQVPQTVVIEPVSPAVTPVVYYCKATGTNYPETMTCPGGWSVITGSAPPQS